MKKLITEQMAQLQGGSIDKSMDASGCVIGIAGMIAMVASGRTNGR